MRPKEEHIAVASLITPVLEPLALGLGALIGADIIATIISTLTWNRVGLLGLVVIVRTFLSFSLKAEIDGEWPWQQKSRENLPNI